MATKLTASKVVSNSPVSTAKSHLYKFKVVGDYEWDYVETSGNDVADAQQAAIDEHFRQNGVLPVSVTLYSQIN